MTIVNMYDNSESCTFNGIEMVQWDDIKESHIYHMPKIGDRSRKDILVTIKTPSIMFFKELSVDGVVDKRNQEITRSFLKRNNIWKFLVELKPTSKVIKYVEKL